MELRGKTAIVTGGGSGIGRATALRLAAQGCQVVIASLDEEELTATAQAIRDQTGGEAIAFCADLCREEQIDGLIALTVEAFGTIDIVVNAAGVIVEKPYMEHTMDDWDRTFAINVRAPFALCRQAMGVMRQQHGRQGWEGGYIVNICSTAINNVHERFVAYGASKHALYGLTQACRSYGEPFGIRASTISPDVTDTAMARGIRVGGTPDQWMRPDDIARMVTFLLETDARMSIDNIMTRNNWRATVN
ncbi:SDR family NAD(P)-dependent oxidoreductase [Paenibacillus koleovorans]|uniref:SDR family NAD(P)-dependent oxidoreductase n=1 Tax=Paenibacillus koleovorans TaxID=121608 RepID=UPI000FD8CCE8|nr:SDR family oxidoreductase [Paenibacillus koleovorans]